MKIKPIRRESIGSSHENDADIEKDLSKSDARSQYD